MMNPRNQPDIIYVSRSFWEVMDGELCARDTLDPVARKSLMRIPLERRFQSFKRRLDAALARRRT